MVRHLTGASPKVLQNFTHQVTQRTEPRALLEPTPKTAEDVVESGTALSGQAHTATHTDKSLRSDRAVTLATDSRTQVAA